MATVLMFQNYSLTASAADTGRLVSFTPGQDWVAVGVIVSALSGSPTVTFRLDWSLDGTVWTTDPTPIATVTAAGAYFSGKRSMQGFYWRLNAALSGTGSVVCTAGAIY